MAFVELIRYVAELAIFDFRPQADGYLDGVATIEWSGLFIEPVRSDSLGEFAGLSGHGFDTSGDLCAPIARSQSGCCGFTGRFGEG